MSNIEVGASYMYLDTRGEKVTTHDLGEGVLVDVFADGAIAGIERIGGPIETPDLMRVLRATRLPAAT